MIGSALIIWDTGSAPRIIDIEESTRGPRGQALVETVILVSLVAMGIFLVAAAFDKAVSGRMETLLEFIALPLP